MPATQARVRPGRIALTLLLGCPLILNAPPLCAQTAASERHLSQPSKARRRNQPSLGRGVIQFENVVQRSGIKFILKNSVSPKRYTFETMAGGVAIFDYDNDGLLDIFFNNGAAIPSLEKAEPAYWNRLFHNNGDGTFTDVTANAGVAGNIPKLGKAWSVAAGWFDYNNDGRLDLFVVNYLNYSIATAKPCVQQGHPAYCSPVDFLGTPDLLYRNNGDGTFTDVSEQAHISNNIGKGMGLAFSDYDDDGFEDIFVSNDTFENYL